MLIERNIPFVGAVGRSSLLDVLTCDKGPENPLIIFVHGFKGFKDWGHWDLACQGLCTQGLNVIKFNFSHNGVTNDQPEHFADLEAFGQNNYSKEEIDLHEVLRFAEQAFTRAFATRRVALIGHSRGGGMAIIHTCHDARIAACVTWASVDRLDYAWHNNEAMEEWRNKGVSYIYNGRTGQQMPVYYQLYEDFVTRRAHFDIHHQLSQCDKPFLFIHGTNDTSVPDIAADLLQSHALNGRKLSLQGADHVLDGGHPYTSDELPYSTHVAIDESVKFLRDIWKP